MGSSLIQDIQYSVFVGEAKEGETPIMRHPSAVNVPLREVNHLGTKTMWEAFEINLVKGRGKKNFIGYRKKISKDELEKKYTWITYEEANTKMVNFSKGLKILDLCPVLNLENETPFRFLGIYSRNKPEWLLSYFGAVRDSITVVTIYDTLGDVAMEFILNQTQLTTIVIEIKATKKILELAKQNRTAKVKNLIVIDKEDDEETCYSLQTLGFNIYTMDQVIEKGKNEGQNIELTKPLPETISTINYTSGTTGNPKGAKIKHSSIIVNTDVIEMLGLYLREGDSYLSFLPYAHIMETLIMAVLVSRGVPIGIYNGNAQKLVEDAQILHPTCMCSVPRVFQRVYDAMKLKLNKLPKLTQKIFQKAIDLKIKDYEETGILTNFIWDNLVFKEIRNVLGGKMRFMLVGGAPVDTYLLKFLKCALSCEIVEGYGQTEDCAGILLARTYDVVGGHLGGPGYSTELKLVDVPDLNYHVTDVDPVSGNKRPRGELCVRGPILFTGYLCDEEKTKEAIDQDGFLHTGDVAMILTEHGNAMKIVDRVKNIFKLQQGEYVAPEKVENIYSGCKYVEQLFIYGDSLQNYLVGILVPKKHDVIEFLKKKGVDANNDNYTDFFEDEDLKKDILDTADSYGRENGLKGFEIFRNVYLCKEPFTVENKILTPTQKIKRSEAKNHFINQINELYHKGK